MKKAELEYNLSYRCKVEEKILKKSSYVVVSTRLEIEKQYSQYDNFDNCNFVCLPPGIDGFFKPYDIREPTPEYITRHVNRYLKNINLPIILAISRPNPKKNLNGLIQSFGTSDLRNKANLVLVMGNRDKLREMKKKDRESYKTIKEALFLIDEYDLYQHVAYPKFHSKQDIVSLYRHAAKVGGVFVNPAHFEPFGLTILEAAACGLPCVVTRNGGSVDIVNNLKNGILINPSKPDEISNAINTIITDRGKWSSFSKNGLRNMNMYTWEEHVQKYMGYINEHIGSSTPILKPRRKYQPELVPTTPKPPPKKV